MGRKRKEECTLAWSKLKNIILLMLLVVNVFLLLLVAHRETRSRSYEEQSRLETLSVLERGGIAMDRALLPKEMELTALSIPRDTVGEPALAAALLGEGTVPDDGGSYTGPGGTVRFYADGAFAYTAAPDAASTAATAEESALTLLGRLGILGTVSLSDGDTLTVALQWNGLRVFPPREISVRLREGTVISAEGYRLPGTPVAEPGGKPLSVVTILLRFLEHIKENLIICSEITGMEAGYALSSTQGGRVTLTPVWHIATDTGEYLFNALTGELT